MRRGRQAAAALAFPIVLAGASLALGACSSSTATAPDPKTTATGGRDGRPNVVVIQADDQTVAQFTRRVMPNTFKLLVDHGTTFKDYIATTALCCPSRASLITGQYAHNHGVFANGGDKGGYQALGDKGNVLPVWLERAGYNTIHLGKFLNGYWKVGDDPAAVGPGWDDWQTLINKEDAYYDYDLSNNGQVVHYGDKPSDYVTRVLERKAVRAIHDYSKVNAPSTCSSTNVPRTWSAISPAPVRDTRATRCRRRRTRTGSGTLDSPRSRRSTRSGWATSPRSCGRRRGSMLARSG